MEKVILKGENFEVINVGKCQFMIKFEQSSYKIINSLNKTRIISGLSIDDNYKLIKFKAESVKSLKDFDKSCRLKHGKRGLLVPDIAKIIRSLSRQLDYLLEYESSTILGYAPENIIVINDEKFAFIGSELVTTVDEVTYMTMISCPFSTSDFFVSPELLKIKELPSYVHYKTAYFSLACLLLFAISGEDEFYKDFLIHKEPLKMLEILNNHPIKDTRIYWLLSRCLIEDAKMRSIIYI